MWQKYLRKSYFIALFFCCIFAQKNHVFGQNSASGYGAILLDAQVLNNPKYTFGIGVMPNIEQKFKSCGTFITTEWLPANRELDKHYFGLRLLGVLRHKFFSTGISLATFTNFNKTFVVFTPEIGVGFKYGFLLYQFNLGKFNRENAILGRHNVSVRFYIPAN